MLALMPLAVAGCAGMPPTLTILSALDCEALLPPQDLQSIRGTPLPPADADAGDLWVAIDGQTARLDLANQRADRIHAIYGACEAQQAKVKALLTPKRPWWKLW